MKMGAWGCVRHPLQSALPLPDGAMTARSDASHPARPLMAPGLGGSLMEACPPNTSKCKKNKNPVCLVPFKRGPPNVMDEHPLTWHWAGLLQAADASSIPPCSTAWPWGCRPPQLVVSSTHLRICTRGWRFFVTWAAACFGSGSHIQSSSSSSTATSSSDVSGRTDPTYSLPDDGGKPFFVDVFNSNLFI